MNGNCFLVCEQSFDIEARSGQVLVDFLAFTWQASRLGHSTPRVRQANKCADEVASRRAADRYRRLHQIYEDQERGNNRWASVVLRRLCHAEESYMRKWGFGLAAYGGPAGN